MQRLEGLLVALPSIIFAEESVRLLLSLLIGFLISWTYRRTSRELVPSQGFVHAVVATCVIATIIVRATSALEVAFVVVGILSLLRFRTVVKDTTEFTFILLTLAVAIALGTSNYFLAIAGGAFTCAVALLLFKAGYGGSGATPFRLKVKTASPNQKVLEGLIEIYASHHLCLGIQKAEEGFVTFHYEVLLDDKTTLFSLIEGLERLEKVAEVSGLLLRREGGLKDARQ